MNHNNCNHNPHRRHYQRNNNQSNSNHYPRNQTNNINTHHNNHINNNTYHQYNPNRYYHRHHNNNIYHNQYTHNRHTRHNHYRNHNNSYPKPSPKHEIISQTTGALIIQQKKQSEPYFYDTQRPIAKRAIANKSSILNNPILDSNEKNQLITNDQICAIQQEAQQLENEQYNIDYTNNMPCSPEPSTDSETDNMTSDHEIETNTNAKNAKFGALIKQGTSIMDYTKHMEMLTDNNKNNLLDNEQNKNKFGIYTKELTHKQAMIIPDKHTLGDCLNNAKIIKKNSNGNNYSNKKKRKNNRRRGGKNNKKNMDIEMDKYDKDEWRIKMEVNAFGRFLDEAKEHTKKNIMKS